MSEFPLINVVATISSAALPTTRRPWKPFQTAFACSLETHISEVTLRTRNPRPSLGSGKSLSRTLAITIWPEATTSIDSNGPAAPRTPGFTNTNCPDGLRAQVFFPSCWDGVNLDSSDHKSHMAYPDGIDNGRCPPTHPHHLVSIFFEVLFSVAPFIARNDGGRFVLSSGDPTGYALHGDFMNGWDRSVLSRAVATCTADSGVIEDCGVFQNEGRFYTDDENNKCSAANPLPDENNEPGTLLPHLPGCVAVTDGPANATPANVVPGCVAGKSGAVLPNPASSSAPSSASSMAPPASSSMAPPASTMPKPSSSNPPASSGQSPPSSGSASGTPVPTGNQLAGVPTPVPSSSTFTTDLAGASNILNGASPPPMSAASPSPSATDDGYNSGSCGTAMPDPDASAHHRRSRMQRRHGSRLSN
jgi:Domain of unknown function (DUF1996)